MTVSLGGITVTVQVLSSTHLQFVNPADSPGWKTLVLHSLSNDEATKSNAFDDLAGVLPDQGPLVIDKALPCENPSPHGPASFKIEFEGDVDDMTMSIYTEAMICVGTFHAMGSPAQRWQTFPMPAYVYHNFGSGLYYYVVWGSRGEAQSSRYVGKFFILR